MPQTDERQRGTRLADVRLPRYWPVSVFGALFLAQLQQHRDHRKFAELGKELGEITTQRWQETDTRADRLIELSKTLTRLTWVLLLATVVTLVVNVILALR